MERLNVCVVIPAFNEESSIRNVVIESLKYCHPIVVDDYSSDNTGDIASKAGATVIAHKINLGYESALNTGFEAASKMGFEVVITLDADGQHDPSLIDSFITGISHGNDLVIGVRHKFFRISEYIFSIYSLKKFGIKDPCCGIKAYRIELYRDMGFFDSFNSVGTELCFYSVMNNCKLAQIEFLVKERQGISRYGDSLKANLKILKALFFSIRKFR